MKRVFDLCLSITLLILLLPFILLIVLLYVITANMPILYSQARISRYEVPFNLIKFRTLKTNEKDPLAERKFQLGSWLRKTSMDELPQLLNVIKGEMSLVGPRPLPIEYLNLFSKEERRRFQLKPGITGLAQINGGSQIPWERKFEFDLQYVNDNTIINDFYILLKTILVIIRKKDDGLDEKPFTGKE